MLPSLIQRFHEATQSGQEDVVIWGSGMPRREFLHVDDMAAASLFVLNLPKPDYDAGTTAMLSHINVGSGIDVSILELAHMVAKVTGYSGQISTDTTRPDGAPRKLMNVTRLKSMGWQAKIALEDGLSETYSWFLQNNQSLRG